MCCDVGEGGEVRTITQVVKGGIVAAVENSERNIRGIAKVMGGGIEGAVTELGLVEMEATVSRLYRSRRALQFPEGRSVW